MCDHCNGAGLVLPAVRYPELSKSERAARVVRARYRVTLPAPARVVLVPCRCDKGEALTRPSATAARARLASLMAMLADILAHDPAETARRYAVTPRAVRYWIHHWSHEFAAAFILESPIAEAEAVLQQFRAHFLYWRVANGEVDS